MRQLRFTIFRLMRGMPGIKTPTELRCPKCQNQNIADSNATLPKTFGGPSTA